MKRSLRGKKSGKNLQQVRTKSSLSVTTDARLQTNNNVTTYFLRYDATW